jgi:hypothetical protein
LRVRIEQAVPVSSVIAITSATAQDGKEIAARGLAYSLSLSGYSTLFIDTALATRTLAAVPRGLGIEEIGRRQVPSESAPGRLAVLTLDDITLHRTTSLRGMRAALDILRSKFGRPTAFGEVVAAGADAVLASVRLGRRPKDADGQLAAALGQARPRFVGVVTICPKVIASNATALVPAVAAPVKRRRIAPAWAGRLAHPWLARLTGDRDASGPTGDAIAPAALIPGSIR